MSQRLFSDNMIVGFKTALDNLTDENIGFEFALTPAPDGTVMVMIVAWAPSVVLGETVQIQLPAFPQKILEMDDYSKLAHDLVEGIHEIRSQALAESEKETPTAPGSDSGIVIPGG